jgi:carbonic anhydrase
VPTYSDETILKNLVSLKDLLPAQTKSFYRYSGSLTTPKCNEIVIWTVFDNPVAISEQQASRLAIPFNVHNVNSFGIFVADE